MQQQTLSSGMAHASSNTASMDTQSFIAWLMTQEAAFIQEKGDDMVDLDGAEHSTLSEFDEEPWLDRLSIKAQRSRRRRRSFISRRAAAFHRELRDIRRVREMEEAGNA